MLTKFRKTPFARSTISTISGKFILKIGRRSFAIDFV